MNIDNSNIDVLVVVPVYNHASQLRNVVEACLKVHSDVLVVDDGSRDDVSVALRGLKVPSIRHDRNRGKGRAILTGAEYARHRGKTHIISIDADGQHPPDRIPDFLKAIRDQPEAIIIGVRDFASSNNVPGFSKFGRSFGNFWVRLQTGVAVHDIQSGYRAYPGCILENLKMFFLSYAFENEVLVRAAWAGVPIKEINVSVHYPRAEERVSHFCALRDNLKLTLLNTALTFRSIIPWPHKRIDYDKGTYSIIVHPLRLVRNALKSRKTPAGLALAAGLGIFLGVLPLIACHTIVIIYAASRLRLNKAIAVLASHTCMSPLVLALCIETGYLMSRGSFLTLQDLSSLSGASFREVGHMGVQMIWQWLIGSLLVAPVLAIIVALVVYALSMCVHKGLIGAESG